jgi:subfamily B ATP-binding cassette protein MsbA
MFNRLLLLPSDYFDNQSTGSIVSRFSYDVEQIKDATTNAIIVLVKDSLIIVGLIAWMLYLDWSMAFITLLAGPFIILIATIVRKRLREMSRKVQQTVAVINSMVTEVFNANKIIKLYGGHALEMEKFHDAINDNRRYSMKFINATLVSGPLVQLIAAVALAVIIYYATGQAAMGQLSVGTFVSFFAALVMLLDALRRLIKVNEFIQKGLAGCESIFQLLDQETELDNGIQQPGKIIGHISVRDLRFAYDDNQPVLRNVSFEIDRGKTLAIVGESGSGKSTLINLIPRFYESPQGTILIDGTDIKEYRLGCLRDNIGFVSQDVKLFNDTIRNNIAYGQLRDKSDKNIEEAARAAHAMDFINDLPQGLNTMVGENGVKLSGGQRQRIALARALLKKAVILILDEATSSLDSDSERQIKSALAKLKHNHTLIVIAHRLSTIEHADRIIVIDEGQIVQQGTHTELVQQQGAYASLYAAGFCDN